MNVYEHMSTTTRLSAGPSGPSPRRPPWPLASNCKYYSFQLIIKTEVDYSYNYSITINSTILN